MHNSCFISPPPEAGRTRAEPWPEDEAPGRLNQTPGLAKLQRLVQSTAMKAPYWVLAVLMIGLDFAATPVQAQASSTRLINGNSSNATGVEAWTQNQQGARSLTAWKRIGIVQMISKIGNCYLCVANVDSSQLVKILVADLPVNLAARAAHSGGVNALAINPGKTYSGYSIWDCGYDTRDAGLRAVTPAFEKAEAAALAKAGTDPRPASQLAPATPLVGGPAAPVRTPPRAAAAPMQAVRPPVAMQALQTPTVRQAAQAPARGKKKRA